MSINQTTRRCLAALIVLAPTSCVPGGLRAKAAEPPAVAIPQFVPLPFYKSILDADLVVAGTPIIRFCSDRFSQFIYEIKTPQILYSRTLPNSSRPMNNQRVLLFEPATSHFYDFDPAPYFNREAMVWPEKPQLLFLKQLPLGSPELKQFKEVEGDVVYVACKGRQSAVVLKFDEKDVDSVSLQKLYKVPTAAYLLDAMGPLTNWQAGVSVEAKLDTLFKLLDTHKNEVLYRENLLPLIEATILKEKSANASNTDWESLLLDLFYGRRWQESVAKHRVLNGLVTLLNKKKAVPIYTSGIPFIIESMGAKLTDKYGAYQIDQSGMPGSRPGSVSVGMLSEN